MLSKLWHGGLRIQHLLIARVKVLRVVPARRTSIVPPTQYDTPLPKRMMPITAMVNNWETIPLFVTTGISILILIIAIGWAVQNKVDVVWTTHSRDNISRTMDLRNPTCHKMLTINQKYEPWFEMADAFDAMTAAERRLKVRMELAKACVPKP